MLVFFDKTTQEIYHDPSEIGEHFIYLIKANLFLYNIMHKLWVLCIAGAETKNTNNPAMYYLISLKYKARIWKIRHGLFLFLSCFFYVTQYVFLVSRDLALFHIFFFFLLQL